MTGEHDSAGQNQDRPVAGDSMGAKGNSDTVEAGADRVGSGTDAKHAARSGPRSAPRSTSPSAENYRVGTDLEPAEWTASDETIAIVGAGPGDPGLLTVRAWRLLESADVVLYDSLTNEAILDALSDCACIDVGKRSEPRTTQSEIHELLLEHAAKGDRVVRLKGGDPVVFGRGGEEAEFLSEHGVPFRMVPGVTSVVAAPELAGIPLTHREISSSFTVITGHEAAKKEESHIEWDALANRVEAGETLVVVMGVKRLPDYVSTLLDRGVPEETPVAMIEKVTWDEQQTVTGTLGSIVRLAEDAEITPPATTIIGGVVDVRDRIECPSRDRDSR